MKAWYRRGKMHFDEEAWALIIKHARKQHKSTKYIVIAGLKRGFKHDQKIQK